MMDEEFSPGEGLSRSEEAYRRLSQRIGAGEFKPGDRFPGEPQLAVELGVSRVTLRRVLDRLMAEGVVERRAGAGTYIRAREFDGPVTLDLASLLARLRGQSQQLEMQLIESIEIAPPLSVYGALRLAPGERIRRIARLRLRDGKPMGYAIDYVPMRLFSRLQAEDLARDFLLGRLAEQLGDVERGAQNVNAEAASSEIARYLGLSLADPVLSITRSFYDNIGRGILFTQGFFRPDRFQLQFDALRAGFSLRRGDR
ncbi:MAG: GntR family transcriptional regulator [Rhabdaerophilum sp.]